MHFLPNAAAVKRGEAGAKRPTTIRDAKKLNLNPSVTTIAEVLNKGSLLEDWKIRQALYAALVAPGGLPVCGVNGDGTIPEDDPTFREWAEACMIDARRQVQIKAERGGLLHDAMMLAHHRYDTIAPQYLAHVDGMFTMLRERFGQRTWVAEHSFAHRLGFGGCIDLHARPEWIGGHLKPPIILDYKFKDFGPGRQASYFVYDEHKLQLGGYSIGIELEDALLFNAFGSISDPGLVLVHEHPASDADYGRELFLAALRLYQVKSGHIPKWPT